jgi:hypothetical protein
MRVRDGGGDELVLEAEVVEVLLWRRVEEERRLVGRSWKEEARREKRRRRKGGTKALLFPRLLLHDHLLDAAAMLLLLLLLSVACAVCGGGDVGMRKGGARRESSPGPGWQATRGGLFCEAHHLTTLAKCIQSLHIQLQRARAKGESQTFSSRSGRRWGDNTHNSRSTRPFLAATAQAQHKQSHGQPFRQHDPAQCPRYVVIALFILLIIGVSAQLLSPHSPRCPQVGSLPPGPRSPTAASASRPCLVVVVSSTIPLLLQVLVVEEEDGRTDHGYVSSASSRFEKR